MKPALATYCLLSCLLLAGCSTLDTPSRRTQNTSDWTLEPDAPYAGQSAPAAGRPGLPASSDDFWAELRSGLQLGGTGHRDVQHQLAAYRRNSDQVKRIFQRGSPYLPYIHAEVKRRGFPAEITLLPFVESSYDPFAYSHGRASGLWQFIPGTARMYGLQQDWWYDGRRDVIDSTSAALDYLERLHREFDGDWLLALAAYNSGEGTVSRALGKNRRAGRPTDFWHLDLPSETAVYVPRLLAIGAIVSAPDHYGIELEPLANRVAFEIVDTGGQLDLAVAAELAGVELEELYRLNPGFNRWATRPDGPHRLAVPAGKAAQFRSNLAALPDSQRVKWVRHRIGKGETLSHIARRYDTTVGVLRNTNALKGSTIRAGGHLLVPVAAKQPARYAALAERLQPAHASASRIDYRVRDGDSLWTIARQHRVTVNQVTRWNRLDSGSLIRPGQQLVIWQTGSRRNAGKTVRTVHYRVRNGDSLYRIAQKFSVSITDLRRWNDLSKGRYLQPGQRLKLYVDVTRLSDSSQG